VRRLEPTSAQTKVHFHITFHFSNDSVRETLESMLSNVKVKKPSLSDLFIREDTPYSKTSTPRWSMAHIGSISTSLTSYDISGITGIAEYNEPDIAVLRLSAKLGRIDPKLRICFTFEDEYDSFMGATIFEGAGGREHWWARLENIPEIEGENKVVKYRGLRDDFVRSRLGDGEEQNPE